MRCPVKEWTDQFNSFNSLKGLLFRPWMEAILSGDFLPPVEASIDPIYDCNLDCVWCSSCHILEDPALRGSKMTRDHLLKLCRFLGHWGVKGACFAGGGEPFLHENVSEAVEVLWEMGVQSAFLTNGTVIRDKDIDTMIARSRWVGCSVDAAGRETYGALKRTSPGNFDRAMDFLREVCARKKAAGSRLEVSFKYLLFPENVEELYDGALLAKKTGVDYIHIRPVAWENIHGGCNEPLKFDLDLVNRLLEKTFQLEDDNFRVYGIRHKFSPALNLRRGFSRCRAAPLLVNLGADGGVYLCVDHQGCQAFRIGSHHPDPWQILDFWGGNRHRQMMEQVDLCRCPRCTFGVYNEIMEKVLIQDRMCRVFP